MDRAKTINYYEALNSNDICQCDYCRNYIKQIRASYPLVSERLESMGIDVEKPFETMPLEPDADGYIEYAGPQYIVMGNRENFEKTEVSDVFIDIAMSHPSTDIRDNHFVIEVYPIRLKWDI